MGSSDCSVHALPGSNIILVHVLLLRIDHCSQQYKEEQKSHFLYLVQFRFSQTIENCSPLQKRAKHRTKENQTDDALTGGHFRLLHFAQKYTPNFTLSKSGWCIFMQLKTKVLFNSSLSLFTKRPAGKYLFLFFCISWREGQSKYSTCIIINSDN